MPSTRFCSLPLLKKNVDALTVVRASLESFVDLVENVFGRSVNSRNHDVPDGAVNRTLDRITGRLPDRLHRLLERRTTSHFVQSKPWKRRANSPRWFGKSWKRGTTPSFRRKKIRTVGSRIWPRTLTRDLTSAPRLSFMSLSVAVRRCTISICSCSFSGSSDLASAAIVSF